MFNWNSIDHDRQRRAALRRQADATRLAANLTPRRHSAFRPLIVWTGRRMVTIGFRLLVHAREWDYRSNTVYNGANSFAQNP